MKQHHTRVKTIICILNFHNIILFNNSKQTEIVPSNNIL